MGLVISQNLQDLSSSATFQPNLAKKTPCECTSAYGLSLADRSPTDTAEVGVGWYGSSLETRSDHLFSVGGQPPGASKNGPSAGHIQPLCHIQTRYQQITSTSNSMVHPQNDDQFASGITIISQHPGSPSVFSSEVQVQLTIHANHSTGLPTGWLREPSHCYLHPYLQPYPVVGCLLVAMETAIGWLVHGERVTLMWLLGCLYAGSLAGSL